MASRYSARIKGYCTARGIEIPSGFHRHPASCYAAIELDSQPPKLVARTWFSQDDMLHYVRQHAAGRRLRLLDFKAWRELHVDGAVLRRGKAFGVEPVAADAADAADAALSPETMKRVMRLFAPEQVDAAARLLVEQCGNNLPFLDKLDAVGLERYRFAALKLSEGRLDKLRAAVELARIDWRDLLVNAGFADDVRTHERWLADEPPG